MTFRIRKKTANKSKMPNYKLIYFNGKGRAEIARFIFAHTGVQYEDVRVTGDEFGKMKPTLPAGCLPILEIDGEQLAGSGVIARFLAEEYGCAAAMPWRMLK